MLDAHIQRHLEVLAPNATAIERSGALCSTRITMRELEEAAIAYPYGNNTPILMLRGLNLVKRVRVVGAVLDVLRTLHPSMHPYFSADVYYSHSQCPKSTVVHCYLSSHRPFTTPPTSWRLAVSAWGWLR
jgi:hypothetical protein